LIFLSSFLSGDAACTQYHHTSSKSLLASKTRSSRKIDQAKQAGNSISGQKRVGNQSRAIANIISRYGFCFLAFGFGASLLMLIDL
jgi:hypothetical protein